MLAATAAIVYPSQAVSRGSAGVVDLLAMALSVAVAGQIFRFSLLCDLKTIVCLLANDIATTPGRAGHGYHQRHGTGPAFVGHVADDAEGLVADEPEVPVVELVTQESPRKGSSKV